MPIKNKYIKVVRISECKFGEIVKYFPFRIATIDNPKGLHYSTFNSQINLLSVVVSLIHHRDMKMDPIP